MPPAFTGMYDGPLRRVRTVVTSPLCSNTSHISNKAPETADPGAPTIIVTGHPASGYIRIKQHRRKR
jgi:hypothetical protein